MRSGSCLLIILAMAMAGPAVAQDAGGGATTTSGSSQGSGATVAGGGSSSPANATVSTGDASKSDKGSAKGGGVDVDTAFAPKGKNAKGVTPTSPIKSPLAAPPSVASKPRPVSKPQVRTVNAPAGTRGGVQTATSKGAGLPAGTVPSATRAPSPSASAGVNTPGISGTDLMRPAARTAAVGSLPKGTTGALSGSSFAPRHP